MRYIFILTTCSLLLGCVSSAEFAQFRSLQHMRYSKIQSEIRSIEAEDEQQNAAIFEMSQN